MVLRKPLPDNNLVPAPLANAHPPYPTTPLTENPPPVASSADHAPYSPDLNTSPAFRLKTLDDAKEQKEHESVESDYSDDEWDKSDDDDFEAVEHKDVPDILKPAAGKAPMPTKPLPDALRAGPPTGIPIKKSNEAISPNPTGTSTASYGAVSNTSEQSSGSIPLKTNNPYLKRQMTGQSDWGAETSQQVWGDSTTRNPKYDDAVELPTIQTPIEPSQKMNSLSLDDTAPLRQRVESPDQPPLIALESPSPPPHRDSDASNPWNPGIDMSSLEAAARSYGLPENKEQQNHASWQEQQIWEQSERERRQNEAHASQEVAIRAEQERKYEEEYNREEQAKLPPAQAPILPIAEELAPTLPPRRSLEEFAPTMPPRPINTGIGTVPGSGIDSPTTRLNKQRKEHYQIKHIRWHDVNKPGIRTSPILTQNLNGPCPLLALVNALVLSTPAGIETALIETLRTREQVSLGLLLDAVFDELMSGRRGGAAQELPDVSDLYKFLLALHTGLNVNPMFVPDMQNVAASSTLTNRAGGFENTPDMKLYRTFDIPLMHGWLPETSSEAYAAFERVAKSYETSQYVQFQEEELDTKLQAGEALTTNEQQMFTDIHAIKEFLNRWPTQLTDHGLKVVRDSIKPGQVAILFRNDHFSTLFKDPRTNKLLTLVTDQGYSSHDEIVWETLVDVNGQGSELLSGDFRSVDNHTQAGSSENTSQSLLDVDDGQNWTTVQPRRGNQQRTSTQQVTQTNVPTSPTGLSRAEQEDHDLALALQLQEEEDDRGRRDQEQRERNNNSRPRPSNARPSQGDVPPVIPPRRNNAPTFRPTNEPAPPPTYEEAATRPEYHPPQGHPANPNAPMMPQGSAYQTNSGNVPPPRPMGIGSSRPMQVPGIPGRPGRRQSAGLLGQQEDRERCVVM